MSRAWYERNRLKVAEYMRLHRKKIQENPELKEAYHQYHRNRMLRKRYGIDADRYFELLLEQAGLCAICGKAGSSDKSKRYMDIDHCHKTGKVRGLLCGLCNKRLGILEDTEFIEKAKKYLARTGKR